MVPFGTRVRTRVRTRYNTTNFGIFKNDLLPWYSSTMVHVRVRTRYQVPWWYTCTIYGDVWYHVWYHGTSTMVRLLLDYAWCTYSSTTVHVAACSHVVGIVLNLQPASQASRYGP
jgi:hypothetical protein